MKDEPWRGNPSLKCVHLEQKLRQKREAIRHLEAKLDEKEEYRAHLRTRIQHLSNMSPFDAGDMPLGRPAQEWWELENLLYERTGEWDLPLPVILARLLDSYDTLRNLPTRT